jgi:hypothetical protein
MESLYTDKHTLNYSYAKERQEYFIKCQYLEIDSRWKHYKGGRYRIIGFGMLSKTDEMAILYVNDDKPLPFPLIKSFNAWTEQITDGTPRFQRISKQKNNSTLNFSENKIRHE